MEMLRRILSAVAGTLTGLAILTLAPNEQWISLPLFFALAGWGTVFALRRYGVACVILFAIGIVAMFAEAFVFPARDIVFGFAHLFSLITATLAAALVGLLFFRKPVPVKSQGPTPGAPLVISAAATCGLLAAYMLLPVQLNVATVSSLATALSLTLTGGSAATKFLGGLLGIVAALVFLIPINISGNDLAVFYWVSQHSSGRLSSSPCGGPHRPPFSASGGHLCHHSNDTFSAGSIYHRFHGEDLCRGARALHWIGLFFALPLWHPH